MNTTETLTRACRMSWISLGVALGSLALAIGALTVTLLGCTGDAAPTAYEEALAQLGADLRRVPRPVQLHYVEPATTPGDTLTAFAWGGIVEPLTPDTARICQVWHAETDTPARIIIVTRAGFISGMWLDNGDPFEWPEE